MLIMVKPQKSSKKSFIEKARRKQILEVAAALFLEKGFRNTSLEEIAKQAEVSRGVIFYYFDGKQDIGEQTIVNNLIMYGKYVEERVTSRKPGRNQLLEFVDACLDYQYDHRELYLLTVELVGSIDDSDNRFKLSKKVNANTRKWLLNIINTGKDNGEFPRISANDLADVIQGFIDGMMQLSAIDYDVVNLKGCKKLIQKMILKVTE